MHFAQPSFLIVALLAGAALVALLAHQAAARRRAQAQLVSLRLRDGLTVSVSRARRAAKGAMLVLGVMLVAASLARPQLGHRWEQTHRRGVDVLFAVDTSKSMLTPDLRPNRLERAKLAARDLVDRFPDDRVGLIAFAGSAFLQTPLTLDHAIFDESLDALDTDVIPLGGTDVASAIDTATTALSDDAHAKVLVLLTDGEDLDGKALDAAERAAKHGIVVDTIGVGTPAGALIPLPSRAGGTHFVTDENGKPVTSHLDDALLRRIAAATGGSYRPLGDDGQGLAALYRDELSKLPRSDLAARGEQVPIERLQWPLGLGLLLLAIEPLVSERRRAPRARAPRFARNAAIAAATAASLVLLPGAAFASPQSAEQAYRAGKFDRAVTDYARAAKASPGDARLDFDLGAASFRKGDFDGATAAFTRALRTDDLKLQQRAYNDRGDALYRDGERALAAKKTDDAIERWKSAVADYEAALHLDAADGDARYNADFVRRRLAELQKRQDEEKKSNDANENDASNKSGAANKSGSPKNGATPQSSGDDAKQESGDGKQNGDGSQHGQRAGNLSKPDAEALLDSLRGELVLRPHAPKEAEARASEQPVKDW